MFDPAVGFMGVCYGILCYKWGTWKTKEARYLNGMTSSIKLTFVFLFHTVLAPITGTIDLFRRVK